MLSILLFVKGFNYMTISLYWEISVTDPDSKSIN